MSKFSTGLLATVGVVAGIACAIALREQGFVAPVPARPVAMQKSPRDVVTENSVWAERQSRAGLEPQLVELRAFFGAARSRTRPFAEKALSFDSKLKLVGDKVFGSDDHERFIRNAFESYIFDPAKVDEMVAQTVGQYVRHLEDVDSQLLVRLRADFEELPREALPAGTVDLSQLQAAMAAAVKNAVGQVQDEFAGAIGREIVSFIAGEVLGKAATQMAMSAGIVGVGASAGAVTFGVSVIVGLIVDYIVSWIYDEVFDPVGELSRMLDSKLTELEELIVNGDGNTPGLAGQLSNYAQRRAEVRRQALESAVSNPAPVDLAF